MSIEKTKVNIEIEGEDRFYYLDLGGTIEINHPKWSVSGSGFNLNAAYNDVFSNARVISDSYIYEPDSNLSNEGVKLKEWLIRVKPYTIHLMGA